MHTTKFNIESYLSEYLIGKWGFQPNDKNQNSIVRLPKEVYLYNFLHSLTVKKPQHAPAPWGNIEIVVPARKEGNKPPEKYNYISRESALLFNRTLTKFFRADLHEFIDNQKHQHGISIKDACFIFISKYGIESIDAESLAKNYYRWKKKIRSLNQERRSFTSR